MEQHLTCSICKSIFVGPLVLPCSHNFCSYCIRGTVQEMRGKCACPICAADFKYTNNLIKNSVLEDVILEWKKLKKELERLHQFDRNALDHKEGIQAPSLPPVEAVYLKEEEVAEDNYIQTVNSRKRIIRGDQGPSTGKPLRAGGAFVNNPVKSDSATVQCPVCDQNVKEKHINTHIDQQCKTLVVDQPRSLPVLKQKRNSIDDDTYSAKGNESHEDPEFIPDQSAGLSSSRKSKRIRKDRITTTTSSEAVIILDAEYSEPGNLNQNSRTSRLSSLPPKEDNRTPKASVAYSLLKEKKLREILDADGLSSRGDLNTIRAR